MNKKTIILIETIVVATLAIIIVIYGQVLWQKYVLQNQLLSVPVNQDENNLGDDSESVGTLSEQEKLQVLESLKVSDAEAVTPEEKTTILNQLSDKQTESTLSEEEKQSIIDNLQ